MGNMSSRIYLNNSKGSDLVVGTVVLLFKWETGTASEETDVFGFDLCLLHSVALLKGFKVVISGIMVCYFVASHGAKRLLPW